MKNQVSRYRTSGVIMVRRLKKEKLGKEDSGRISLRPPGRSGASLPVNLILKWE